MSYLSKMAQFTAVLHLFNNIKFRSVHIRHILIGNSGSSRAVLCRDGQPVPLSDDHDVTNSAERKRIRKEGGFIAVIDGSRFVNGKIGVTRSFGGYSLKQDKQIVTGEFVIRNEHHSI